MRSSFVIIIEANQGVTLNKHAPVTKITVQNNRLPFVPSDLKTLLRQRDYLRGRANKTGSKHLRQAFQQVRARANFELKKSKKRVLF